MFALLGLGLAGGFSVRAEDPAPAPNLPPLAATAIPLPDRETKLETARVSFVDLPEISIDPASPAQPKHSEALGRTYSHSFLDHPRLLARMSSGEPEYSVRAGEGGAFDLWEVATNRKEDDQHEAIRIEFPLETASPGKVFLGLGFTDNCVVALNGMSVFVCRGSRDRRRNQDLVPLDLVAGRNTITLWCWKVHRWAAVPSDHYTDEWAVEAKLYPNAQSAWTARNISNFHPLDTPIASSAEALRAEGAIEGYDNAALVDLDGREVTRGKVVGDGSIGWSKQIRTVDQPFVGFFVLGEEAIEPIILTGDSNLESISESVLKQYLGRESSRAWPLRVRQLLKTTSVNERDRWWARNLAVAVALSGADRNNPTIAALLAKCDVARIEFQQYASKIDGSQQFYRVYQPQTQEGNCPVALILPSLPYPVRCFLESYPVANLSEAEYLATAAKEIGVTLVWPGYVNADNSGDYVMQNLAECVGDFDRRYPRLGTRKHYAVGSYGSGVTALRAAVRQQGIDGLVLCTPMVIRSGPSGLFGIQMEPINYPTITLDYEAWHPLGPRLATIPTCIIYDADVPGQGDPDSTKWLIDCLRREGTPLELYWPEKPYNVSVWGMRGRDRASRWMNWIKKNEPDPTLATVRLLRSEEPATETVKETLMHGFYVEIPTDPEDRAYLDWWTDLVRQYRGECPVRTEPSTDGDTVVRFRNLALDELAPGSTAWITGKVVDGPAINKDQAAEPNASIWGFRLKKDGKHRPEIEVVRTKGAGSDFPRMDLIVHGSCTGALFLKGARGWELLQIGVPQIGPD